jgi:hypothetical protein
MRQQVPGCRRRFVVSKPKVGDVFIVPTGDDRAGIGQVVGTYGNDAYFFAIFDLVLPADVAAERASEGLSCPVLFLTLSLDAKLHAGHWTVVAHAPVDASIPLPAYKEAVGRSTKFDVVDYTGSRRRQATRLEVETLPNRKVVAPVRLEKVLQASLGLEPWLEAFDELRPKGRITTADIWLFVVERGRVVAQGGSWPC